MAAALDKVKVILVGDSGVGKSSLTHLIAHHQPIANPSWTVGCSVEVKLHEYKDGTPQQKAFFVELWDIGGSSSHRNTRSLFYNPVHGIILVHDLTNRKSQQNLQKWLAEILNKDSNCKSRQSSFDDFDSEQFVGSTQIPILVIGTKLDLAAQVRSSSQRKTSSIAEECGAEEIILSMVKDDIGSTIPLEIKPKVSKLPPFITHAKYEYLVAGMLGGVASTVVLHPLDLIKIRFAVHDGHTVGTQQYRGIGNAFSTIVREEGVRGLYRGVVPNIWGAGTAWGFYFLFYNSFKTWFQDGDSEKPLGPGLNMLAAAQSGVMTLAMTNPFWVVKTRLCLQYGDKTGAIPTVKKYTGMADALGKIYKVEGVRGLYKGFLPGIFGVSHGALQFMAYEELKNRYNQYQNVPINTKLSTVEYLGFAATSKLFAAAVTYPYQVVRARLQDQLHEYKGSWDCMTRTYKFEGARGFYKGLSANLTRVVPATMITFLVYEKSSHLLLNLPKNDKKDCH